MDQQKTMIRMIQDLHRNTQGGQRMSTTSRHTAYFPLGDKQALEALEGDLASQRDLRQELVSCFWFPLFPIHRTMCGTAPQNQHWAPNWFRFFFLRYLNINIVPFIHHLIALFLPDILVHTRKTMRLIWNTAVRTRPSGLGVVHCLTSAQGGGMGLNPPGWKGVPLRLTHHTLLSVCGKHVRDNARRGVHYRELMDASASVRLRKLRPFIYIFKRFTIQIWRFSQAITLFPW